MLSFSSGVLIAIFHSDAATACPTKWILTSVSIAWKIFHHRKQSTRSTAATAVSTVPVASTRCQPVEPTSRCLRRAMALKNQSLNLKFRKRPRKCSIYPVWRAAGRQGMWVFPTRLWQRARGPSPSTVTRIDWLP